MNDKFNKNMKEVYDHKDRNPELVHEENQLVVLNEQLKEKNQRLEDILFELQENLKAAEDQNHYYKLLVSIKAENYKLRDSLLDAYQIIEYMEREGKCESYYLSRGQWRSVDDWLSGNREFRR
jgi:hypothetical protein